MVAGLAEQVDAGAGLGREQAHEVAAAQERRRVEVVGGAAVARQRQLVGRPAVDPQRPERPVVGQDLAGLGLGREPVTGGRVDPPQLERGAGRPALDRKIVARPEICTRPGGSGTMSVVRGARPVRNSYITANVSADVATWTWLCVGVVVVLGARDLGASLPMPQTASVGTPAGEGRGGEAVDVDVVRHPGGPLGRAVQVALEHAGAERVPRQVDPVGAGGGEDAVDLGVDRSATPARVVRWRTRVVVDRTDPLGGVPVGREPHGLRLELRGRAGEAVHEHDRVLGRGGPCPPPGCPPPGHGRPQPATSTSTSTTSSANPRRRMSPPPTSCGHPTKAPDGAQGFGSAGPGGGRGRTPPPGPGDQSASQPASAGTGARSCAAAGRDRTRQPLGQRAQRRGAVALERRAVHRGQRAGGVAGEVVERVGHRRTRRGAAQHVLGRRAPRSTRRLGRSSAGPSPSWVNRSPHSSVPVVSSNSTCASWLWGACGVGTAPPAGRRGRAPRPEPAPAAVVRRGRRRATARSRAPRRRPRRGGTRARTRSSAPHSSASTCPNDTHRSSFERHEPRDRRQRGRRSWRAQPGVEQQRLARRARGTG